MKTPKIPREILRELANNLDQLTRQHHTKKDEDYYINQALKDIDALVPKKKECICSKENLWKCDCGAEAYNQAIDETHRIFKK